MTGRPRDLITLSDLRALVQIVEQAPASLVAAAQLVGFDRARLMRLVGRINAQIGADLSWRHDGRFNPPIEARRIAAAFTKFDQALSDVSGSPRISAGTTISMLLVRLIQLRGKTLDQPLAIFRSCQILGALQEDRIDVAFASSESPALRTQGIAFSAPGDVRALSEGLEAAAVAAWTARLIRAQPLDGSDAGTPFAEIEWEPGSTGAELTARAGVPLRPRGFQVRCQSFLEAMELVRRGCVQEAVIPDLYLLGRVGDLSVGAPPCQVTGHLVALYRGQDRERWKWLMDTDLWARLRPSDMTGWMGRASIAK